MTEEIKNIIAGFLSAGDIGVAEIQIQPSADTGVVHINLSTDEAGYLIGENGANLKDFECVIRLMVKKRFPGVSSVFLDVNGYRKEKDAAICFKARQAAKEAVMKKESVVMEPMNAYERRIVHLELSTRPDVVTESIGSEPARRVVIKPYP